MNGSEKLLLHYAERCNPKVTGCMRYAWSTIGYPTLFISHDRSSCKCECNYDIDESAYTANQTHGSINITGTDSYFSLAIVFTRLIEFQVDPKKAKSFSVFNATSACDSETESVEGLKSVKLSSEELVWTLSDDDTLVADLESGNSSEPLLTIKVSF